MVEMNKRPRQKRDVAYDDKQRYDVAVVAANVGLRLADAAAKSIILNLATKYWFRPTDEAVGEDFVEVYGGPGPTAHEIFTPMAYDIEVPVFHEAAFYFGQQAVELKYGAGLKVWFYLEFRGCVFREPLGPFRKLFKEQFNTRIKTHHRPFTALPEHRAVSEP
jgi:hypothetical protein